MKKVTLKDLSQELGVSQNTISVALRGGAGVNEETRKVIIKKAAELGYVHKKSAVNINILLVTTITSNTDTYFFHHLLSMMKTEINYRNSDLLMLNTNEIYEKYREKHLLQAYLIANNIRGILILGDIESDICNDLADMNLPVVGASFYMPGINMSAVVEDNISASFKAVSFLAQQGYKHIGFIGDISNVSFWERYFAYHGTLDRIGLTFDPDFSITSIEENSSGEMLWSDYEYIANCLSKMRKLPEAFICANDKMAAVTIKAAHTLGMLIPKDLGIIGFDNNEIAKLTIPSITTIDTERELQGIKAVELLFDLMRDTTINNQRIVLPVKLVEGESTKIIK